MRAVGPNQSLRARHFCQDSQSLTGGWFFYLKQSAVIPGLFGNIIAMSKHEPVSQKLFDLYLDRVKQYGLASDQVHEDSDVIWPRMQIRGLYVELALKTYRAVFSDLRHEHSLEVLADRCVADSLQLTDGDRRNIIEKINKPYYEHKGWDAKYICRYPSENQSLIAWDLPQHAKTREMVERIVDQATLSFASVRA